MSFLPENSSLNLYFIKRAAEGGNGDKGGVLIRDGIPVRYTIRYSTRCKRLSIRILPDRSVQVVSPLDLSGDIIHQFVIKNENWVFRHVLSDSRARAAEHSYTDGEEFLFLGKNHRLCIEHDSKRPDVLRNDEEIIIRLPYRISGPEPVVIRKILEFFYKKELFSVILPMVDHYAAMTGVTPLPVKIHNQKTKWGSCTRRSLIFNLRLCMAPTEIIEYVVVHEICHLRQRNHSPAFWHEVEMVLPDYKKRERYLKESGPQYLLNE